MFTPDITSYAQQHGLHGKGVTSQDNWVAILPLDCLQKATLGLSVKVTFYCHATKCMKLALTGGKEQRARGGRQMMLLHIQQGFVLINSG